MMTTTKMILACTTALIGGICHASAIVDTFDYGSINQSLVGLGGSGSGWGGAWSGDALRADYRSVPNLTYTGVGYNNALNPVTGSGVSSQNADSNLARIPYREFDTRLTGTVWASVLIRTNGEATSENNAVLWFSDEAIPVSDLDVGIGVGLRDGNRAYMRYAGNKFPTNDTTDSQENTMQRDQVNLVLVRLSLDYNALNHDRAEAWFNPDMSAGYAGLGAPKITFDSSDLITNGIDRVGVSFQRSAGTNTLFSEMDAIRISNTAGEQGFLDVTAIPELSTLSLLGMSLLVLVFQLRHRRN